MGARSVPASQPPQHFWAGCVGMPWGGRNSREKASVRGETPGASRLSAPRSCSWGARLKRGLQLPCPSPLSPGPLDNLSRLAERRSLFREHGCPSWYSISPA